MTKRKFRERRIEELSGPCYRPLGLSLAILFTAVAYGLIPLLPLLPIVWSRLLQRGVGVELTGGLGGFFGIVVGILTLIACLLAWRGRPPGTRVLLLLLVWVATGSLGLRILQSIFSQPDVLGVVGGSLSSFNGLICQVPIFFFVPVYVTWYMNRAPAREYYNCRNR